MTAPSPARRHRHLAGVAAAAAVALVPIAAASAAPGDLVLVAGDSGPPSNGSSVVISGDGRMVAFRASASGRDQVYVHDVPAGSTILASRASGASGAPSDGDAQQMSISANGTVVAFSSSADNLSSRDDDDVQDVFTRNLRSGVTQLVSSAGVAPIVGADNLSQQPSVAADGRIVAFASLAGNLTPGTLVDGGVFVRDLGGFTPVLASRASGLAGAPANGSFQPSISADGRVVAYASPGEGLVMQVAVRDLATGETRVASRASGPAGEAGDGSSDQPALSADGRFVAFTSRATNLSSVDDDLATDIFRRDLLTGQTVLVSRATDGAGADADANSPAISGDGRYVAFVSAAPLTADDADALADAFVHDLDAGTTALVSHGRGPVGPAAEQRVDRVAISVDGRFAAFDAARGGLGSDRPVFRAELARPAEDAAPVGAPPSGGAMPAGLAARCEGRVATIVGTPVRDVLRGTRRRDVIVGRGGADTIAGRGGDDLVCAGTGADTVTGGPGADRILGGPGRDLLIGGAGSDRLLGNAGRDRARGGRGADHCRAERRSTC